MASLNLAWMLSVLQQAIANTASDQPTWVGEFPEITALKDAGLIKIDKRKKGEEAGTYWASATETASEAAFHTAFPATAAPAPAPAAPVETAPAPVAPQFDGVQQDVPAPAPAPAAPVTEQAAPVATDTVIGTDAAPQVVDTVTIGDSTISIQTGIAFVKHKPTPPKRSDAADRPEKYPFSVLAKLKYDNMHSATPDANFIPSFHVANVATKNFSGNVTRANPKYEASHGVTFRVTAAAPNDPNGAGVRVFCMSVDQAPARATRKAKTADGATQTEQTPVA